MGTPPGKRTNVAREFIANISYRHEKTLPESTKDEYSRIIWKIAFWPRGLMLLKKVNERQKNKRLLEIWPRAGVPTYKAGTIEYDFRFPSKDTPMFELTQEFVVACKKTYIYFAHELIHHLHNLEGTFKADDLDEECRTVGLYQYDHNSLTENWLRQEMGLPRRPCYQYYNGVSDSKQLLNAFNVWKKQKNHYLPELQIRKQHGRLPPQDQIPIDSLEYAFRLKVEDGKLASGLVPGFRPPKPASGHKKAVSP